MPDQPAKPAPTPPPPATKPAPPAATVAVIGARFSLGLLIAINLVNYVDRSVLAAVLSDIQREIFTHGETNQNTKLGILSTAFMVSYMITSPIFGWLGDRARRWALVGIGVILWSLASGAAGVALDIERLLVSAGLGAASGFTVMLITRMFVGVGEAAYGPIAPTLISDMYPVSRRGAVLAWFYIAIPVGTALGFVLGGWIGHSFGWRMAFFAVVPPGLLLGVLCFFRKDPPRGAADHTSTSRKSRLGDYMILARTPSYVLNVAGMTAMTFATGGVQNWMPTYLHAFRKAGELDSVNYALGGILVVGGLTATLIGGWVGDKLRPRYPGSYFLVSGAVMVLAFPLFVGVIFTPFPWCWGVIALAVFCLFFNTGPTNTIIANVTHPAMRATAFAVCILIIHALGDVISPTLIGLATDWAGGNMNVGFGLVSGAVLLSGLLWLLGTKHLARDTDKAATRLPR